MNNVSEARLIRWPDRFDPRVAPVHVRNELNIDASPEKIWQALIEAPHWPGWYVNAKDVQILSGGDKLESGTTFRWTTFGASIVSEVVEFVQNERIAWTGRAPGIDVYHAWLIAPSETGSWVLTEETQYGLLARIANILTPQRMHRFHQIWLETLAQRARSLNAAG